MDEFANLDATAQADLVRRGEVAPTELVEAAIARIEALNPALNCVVTATFERARDRAGTVAGRGPLAGVPYLLKDLGPTLAGVRQTAGSRALLRHVPARTSSFVTRLEHAGLMVVGVTASPEAGNHSTTEPVAFGPARNPWDLERTTGGSSGGAAAAVAARLVPAAHGSDGGGSIRIPSSCCGVFGLKPSRGRVSAAPAGEDMNGLAVNHAVTVSVRDSAALLDAVARPEPGDPYRAAAPPRPFLNEVGAPVARMRVAWTARPPIDVEVHPECKRAVEEAAVLLTELGHEVVEDAPVFEGDVLTGPLGAIFGVGNAVWAKEVAGLLGREPGWDEFEITTWELVDLGRRVSGVTFAQALEALHREARQIAGFFEDYQVWLTPALAQPPEPLGVLNVSYGGASQWWQRDLAFNPWNPIANMTGQPAMSLPLHWTAEGLPIGVLAHARRDDEATLFRLAAQFEQARPWRDRLPPVSAVRS